jgi:poly(A) polymerase
MSFGGGRQSLGPVSVPVDCNPVSEDPPTSDDHRRTLALEAFLQRHGRIEPRQRSESRQQALKELGEVVRQWMVRLCESLHLASDPAYARAHIIPFGSVRLGVNAEDADIDTVLLVPRHIRRDRDFFGTVGPQGVPWLNQPANILVNVLKADPRVSQFVPVPDTHTPIITFQFKPVGGSSSLGGVAEPIDIDMACATIPEDFLPEHVTGIPDEYLVGVDAMTMRSMNGTRVADAILASLGGDGACSGGAQRPRCSPPPRRPPIHQYPSRSRPAPA